MKHALFILSVIVVAFVSVALPPGKPVSISGSQVWTNDTSTSYMFIKNYQYPNTTPQSSVWNWRLGLQYDIANGVRSEISSTGQGTLTNSQVILSAHAYGPVENSIVDIYANNDDFNNLNSAYVGITGVTNSYNFGEGTPTGSGMFVGDAISATIDGIVSSTNYTIKGKTNQITFGSTNSPPAGSTSTPSKWISVQVTGESVVYRLPLYQ